MHLQILASAEQDLLDGYQFYEAQQESLGAYFLDSLFSDIDSLHLYAGVHSVHDRKFYRALAKRFPFAIYYDLRDEIITVIAILDCRQNPKSIVTRISKRS